MTRQCVEPSPEFPPTQLGGNSPQAGQGVPCSNTGRKSARTFVAPRKSRLSPDPMTFYSERSGAIIDWLSFTVHCPADVLDKLQHANAPARFLDRLLNVSTLTALDLTDKGHNGYKQSSRIINSSGDAVGHFAVGGNRDTLLVTLTGEGCRVISDWAHIAVMLEKFGAKITRCDVAFDDYDAKYIDLMGWADMALRREIRAHTGLPPKGRFTDDFGHKTGRTLYVGSKGHKELCVYEKGRQLGDPNSEWLRAEVRWWAKDVEIPADVLRQPLAYLRAAYNVLTALPGDVCTRIKTVARTVEACVVRTTAWAHHALGPYISMIVSALGARQAYRYARLCIARNSVPVRFRRFTASERVTLVREAIPHAVGRSNSLGAVLSVPA